MHSKISALAIASTKDVRNLSTWSGIPAHISFAFEDAGIEVAQGSALSIQEPAYYRWLRSGYWRLGLGWFLADVEPKILMQRAAALQRLLENAPIDAVVSVLPDPIASLRPSVATALVHDSTFALLVDYYQQFSGLTKRSLQLGHEAYRKALDHASVAIYSSEWAASSAVHDYGADPKKVRVIEFGANLRNPPSRRKVAAFVESRLKRSERRFLFLGVEWARKGGDDAIALVKILRRMGVSVVLDVVGCAMEGQSDAREFCDQHGFLDKRKSEDRQKLDNLFQNASFLVVPSVAECFGCVYCEANAYGVPGIGRETGGVAQAIRPGTNGFLLSTQAQGVMELAEQVRPYLQDPEKYRNLAIASRIEYEQRLNWKRFAEKTLHLLENQIE